MVDEDTTASLADIPGSLDRSGLAFSEPLAFFDRAHDAFERATRQTGSVITSRYVIAGAPVTVACATEALASALLPALAHLSAETLGPASTRDTLTICVWDGATPDVVPPAPTWPRDGYRGNTELIEYADSRIRAAFDSYLGMLSLLDVERGLALFWLRDATHVPITLVGTPFRIILQWWADTFDAQLIHAAAVGTRDGAVAISGPSGAGKSTTALTALERGLLYLGDDFILVTPRPTPTVFSLYCSAKVDDATLATRFPSLRDSVHRRPRLAHEKQVLFVPEQWPDRTMPALPLRAIMLPIVTARRTAQLISVGPGDALRSLLPGILAFPGQRQDAVSRLARLARRVPAFRLELGSDGADNARVLSDFLTTLPLRDTDAASSHL